MTDILSRKELNEFDLKAVDRENTGEIRRPYDNADLTDSELRRRIIQRNEERKNTYLLRMEYGRRLYQRETDEE